MADYYDYLTYGMSKEDKGELENDDDFDDTTEGLTAWLACDYQAVHLAIRDMVSLIYRIFACVDKINSTEKKLKQLKWKEMKQWEQMKLSRSYAKTYRFSNQHANYWRSRVTSTRIRKQSDKYKNKYDYGDKTNERGYSLSLLQEDYCNNLWDVVGCTENIIKQLQYIKNKFDENIFIDEALKRSRWATR